jgi:hypothetical protein
MEHTARTCPQKPAAEQKSPAFSALTFSSFDALARHTVNDGGNADL